MKPSKAASRGRSDSAAVLNLKVNVAGPEQVPRCGRPTFGAQRRGEVTAPTGSSVRKRSHRVT